ncbi:hypothetical protein LCGC14_1511050 [marine sediment metagenome]|uniref:Uncharacterized protein n=1 Tax=marine sediment metagenome TaxID=412755 RepID=A0A0F9LGU2_9ZZZZ
MANTFKFVDWLTMESLRILVNKLETAQFFNTDYNKEFKREFAVGETVRVKLPQRFLIRDGLGYSPQAIRRLNTTVVMDQIFGVDFEWDSVEKALKMERGDEDIRREYIDPAMAQIANEIDSRAALFAYQNTNNLVGVLGTDPTTMTTFQQARGRLVDLACPPKGSKGMIIPTQINTSLVPTFTTTSSASFHPGPELTRQWKEGLIGTMSGFEWYESVNLYSHTAGTWAGAVTVNGAGQSGSTLNINCTSGDTFKLGDIFSIANVNMVNPMSRRIVGTVTKQFVITQALTATGSTETLNISPAIEGPGSQYQNVDALAIDTAALTLFPGTSSPNGKSGIQALALHRDAFALVGVKLELPTAVEMSAQHRDPKTGLAVRFIRQFDAVQSKMVNRFDILCGFGKLYADNCAVRVQAG